MWQYWGQQRPPFAETTAAGQESAWDYPRPPVVERSARSIEVSHAGRVLARTTAALRVLETASAPTYYLPAERIDLRLLAPAPGRSICEWKGVARYWALAEGQDKGLIVGWSYAAPTAAFIALRDCIAFYPARATCSVDGEQAFPQPGGYYGGWVTNEIAGPFKGGPDTGHW